jgi:hypothetical protein
MKTKFIVKNIRPDMREFRQNSLEIVHEGLLQVVVDIPEEFVLAYENGILDITLAGLKWLADQFDITFKGETKQQKNDYDSFNEDESEVDFEDETDNSTNDSNEPEWDEE